MLVLDTDVLTVIQWGSGPEHARLTARLAAVPSGTAHVTIVTVEEQMRGWLSYVARARTAERQIEAYGQLHTFVRGLNLYPILEYDRRAVDQFDRLRKQRTRVGTMDLRIAAIALAHGATLISRNLADFRKVLGLRVEDWTVP